MTGRWRCRCGSRLGVFGINTREQGGETRLFRVVDAPFVFGGPPMYWSSGCGHGV
jgi:hypothetical protein